jgi:hypothetical protein
MILKFEEDFNFEGALERRPERLNDKISSLFS